MLKIKGKKNPVFIVLFIVLLLIIIMSLFYFHQNSSGQVMVVSVSTDGNYAITTDLKRNAILWDLQNHTKKILDKKANIYSAYFIKNSNNFMWQHDIDNNVIIENTSGKIVKKFNPGFPTYGQVMTSNLENYLASDEQWNIYKINFNNKQTNKSIIKKGLLAPNFIGSGKLINMMFDSKNQYLLTCGFADDEAPLSAGQGSAGDKHWSHSLLAGVVLWDVDTGQPLKKYYGNVYKTFATLSPDGNTVVAGDEQPLAYVWNALTGKRTLTLTDIDGVSVKDKNGIYHLDTTGFLAVPKDFKTLFGSFDEAIFSLKFIDDNHYLRFTTYAPNYAILYSITDPKPLKYLSLGHHPKISVDQYIRDQSIDTSPQAHILVTGKINQGGILVYKYSTQTQTLKKIWNGK